MDTETVNDIVAYICKKCTITDSAHARKIVDSIYDKLIQSFEQQKKDQARKAKEFAASQTIPFANRKAETDSEEYLNNLQKGFTELNRKKKC